MSQLRILPMVLCLMLAFPVMGPRPDPTRDAPAISGL